jgi:indolepyruvate ferredoxin oxidoreductase
VAASFDGDLRLEFHLAPPLLAKHDKVTGRPRKMHFGPWMMRAFDLLARFRFLRGTPFDPFGYSAERRTERRLIAEYEELVDELLARLDRDNHAVAVQLAALPDEIRGFGHVKAVNLQKARDKWGQLLARFRGQQVAQVIRMPSKAA